jgi:hypothetical protein
MAAQSIVEATRRTDATADAAVTLTTQAQAAGQADSESQIASTPQEHAERQVSRLPRLCSLHTALPMCRCEKMRQRARLSHCSWLQDELDGLASTAQTAGRCGDGLHISVRFAQQREAVLQERIVELTGARQCITILQACCCVMLTLASETSSRMRAAYRGGCKGYGCCCGPSAAGQGPAGSCARQRPDPWRAAGDQLHQMHCNSSQVADGIQHAHVKDAHVEARLW